MIREVRRETYLIILNPRMTQSLLREESLLIVAKAAKFRIRVNQMPDACRGSQTPQRRMRSLKHHIGRSLITNKTMKLNKKMYQDIAVISLVLFRIKNLITQRNKAQTNIGL